MRVSASIIALILILGISSTQNPAWAVSEGGGTDVVVLTETIIPPVDPLKPPRRPPPPSLPPPLRNLSDVAPNTITLLNGTSFCSSEGSSFFVQDSVRFPTPLFITRCPGVGRRATPTEAAYQVWYYQTKLPKPTLATSPPKAAITGLDLYLAIGGPQTLVIDDEADGYNVHLEVTSVYDIDWGDPDPDTSVKGKAVTKDFPTQGGLYPKGNLRHQYIQRGQVTVKVTQRWQAKWTAGGDSGTITDRLATTQTLTFPVQEIQAVLQNP